ncbi:hypothetical protein M011DRAFT_269283 [Sporormia fimetaria CBS 119925]|uniref:Uncharacterized protein n=1 Tax=Sporormia fimetaria CBS 119925 TaxID=1340428 RepID=A0A6A6UZL3_9PLEO|nr:hypothetical protein M011DRAFT_269283 [Sporormia fimetaria CBS 119925]
MSARKSPWSGPGIFQVFISAPQDSQVSLEILDQWLEKEYVPKLMEAKVATSAWRFKAANAAYGKQNMLIIEVPDLSESKALSVVPRTGSRFPGGKTAEELFDYETRILALEELYETKEQPKDAAQAVIYAAMEPGEGCEADLDKWYRKEHNQQMSKEPGWLRTRRYKLLYTHRGDGKSTEVPSCLAIHEFGEGNNLGQDVEPLQPITDWTKKCMKEAKAIDAAIYLRKTGSS